MDDFLKQQNAYWQGEAQSKSNELTDKSIEAHDARMGKIDAEKRAQAALDEARQYENEVDYFVDLGEKLLIKLKNTEEVLSKTQTELKSYKDLMAEYIFINKVLREITLDLLAHSGKTHEERNLIYKKAESDVFNNKTKHTNNVKDDPFLLKHLERLKSKYNIQ